MDSLVTSKGFVRDPLEWAADCCASAGFETEPDARDAYAQLAEEFESMAAEMEGLISNYQRVIDGYLRGCDKEKLVAALQKTSGPIDVPIADLGL